MHGLLTTIPMRRPDHVFLTYLEFKLLREVANQWPNGLAGVHVMSTVAAKLVDYRFVRWEGATLKVTDGGLRHILPRRINKAIGIA
jgi:hypothetical protein